MKKFCFLVQCLTHCGKLSGRLAILTTDHLRVNLVEQDSASRFSPGRSVDWTPSSGGSSPAIILADLRSCGYDESAHELHTEALSRLPAEWSLPSQFVEAEHVGFWDT